MARMSCYKDVVPFCAMIAVECTNVVVNVLFKAASLKGLSFYVFIVYSFAVSTLVLLLPLPFVFHWYFIYLYLYICIVFLIDDPCIFCVCMRRSRGLPSFKLSLLFRIFLLGVIGFVAQLCGYKAIQYTSPTLASALSNLMPAFTFILAVFFRMEKAAMKSSSTQAKIVGSVVSITGALIVVIYKGPTIIPPSSSSESPAINSPLGMDSSTSQRQWVLGGFLLAIEFFLVPIWYIVQTHVIKLYPAEAIVVFLYNLCGTLVSAPVCLIAEADLSAWKIRPDITLLAIIYSGFFCTGLSSLVHTWGLHLKGPVYVSIFKPLSIAIAAAMSVIFLGDALHLGSVIGALILSVGFYAVIWGKAKEEEEEEVKENNNGLSSSRSPSFSRTPLLQSYNEQEDDREIK